MVNHHQTTIWEDIFGKRLKQIQVKEDVPTRSASSPYKWSYGVPINGITLLVGVITPYF